MIFIEHKETGNDHIVVVSLGGYLDSQTSPDLEHYVEQLLGGNKKYIIFDAGKLEYISSSGIGLVLFLHKRITGSTGYFVICNLRSEIATLFGILGFEKVLTIVSSLEEAEERMLKHVQLGYGPAPMASDAPDDEIAVQIIEDDEPAGSQTGVMQMSGTVSPDDEPPVPAAANENEVFPAPIVVECAECRGLIRVKKSGSYICPDCNTEFFVEEDQTVIF